MNVYDILKFNNLIISKDALVEVEKRLIWFLKKKIKEQEEKPTSKINDLIRKPLVTEKGTLLAGILTSSC